MKFSEKCKAYRKRAGLSQEKLAEKINVSRQAVTKWEGDAGIPDVENLVALAALFGVTVDDLLSDGRSGGSGRFESVTEYDVDRPKRFDIALGGVRAVNVTGYDGEKLRLCLFSETLAEIESKVKIRIDDVKNGIDVGMNRCGVTEAELKEELSVDLRLPQKYVKKAELYAVAGSVSLRSLRCGEIELDVKTEKIVLDGVVGRVEINCNLDMHVDCRTLEGGVHINQICATSRITVPADASFAFVKRGIANAASFERSGRKTESFADGSSENCIELNGMKSELVICKT